MAGRDGTPGGTNRAKKKNPCGHCKKECTSGTSVPCGFCESWFHTACCDGMSEEFRECCDAMNRIYGGSAYLCVICRKLAGKLNGSIQDLNKKMTELEARVKTVELENKVLQEKVSKTETKADQVKEQIGGIEKEIDAGMQKAKKEVKQEMGAEMKKREEKKTNIVVYGVKESEKTEIKERKEDDEKQVAEIAKEIGVTMVGKMEVKYRIRKQVEDDRPKPMVVWIEDEESRARLLENARLLARKPEWRSVYLGPDLTWEQREAARKEEEELRKQADQMTEEAGKEGGTGETYRVIGQRGMNRRVAPVNRNRRQD